MDYDWIFFDCFNTLIDDFDQSGDESGLGSLPIISVENGWFQTESDFVAAYYAVLDKSVTDGREIAPRGSFEFQRGQPARSIP